MRVCCGYGQTINISKNCHDFRTSNGIDMKLGLLFKLEKRYTNKVKKVWQ